MIKKIINIVIVNPAAKLIALIMSRLNLRGVHAHQNPYEIIRQRASLASADYIEPKLINSMLFNKRQDLWDYCFQKAAPIGLFAEFGVFTGVSINYFAKKNPHQIIYGFDSFVGLKEDWTGTLFARGAFNVRGRLPKVASNVRLIKGWFDETLPPFLNEHLEKFSVIHIDADTYITTKLLFGLLRDRIAVGTIIIFDEYHGFPNWERGEFMAWQEFVSAGNLKYEYLGFAPSQAAVLVTKT